MYIYRERNSFAWLKRYFLKIKIIQHPLEIILFIFAKYFIHQQIFKLMHTTCEDLYYYENRLMVKIIRDKTNKYKQQVIFLSFCQSQNQNTFTVLSVGFLRHPIGLCAYFSTYNISS